MTMSACVRSVVALVALLMCSQMELLTLARLGQDLFQLLPTFWVRSPCDERHYLGSFLMMNGWFAELNAETSLGLSDWIRNSPVSEMAVMCAMFLPWSAKFPLPKKVGILYTVKLILAVQQGSRGLEKSVRS